ncbi:cytochrome c [Wenzhouxiangella sp. XN201]|uniref:c-type cytochrome n=1 Tax=Wenzhouxiangella sp. XN201 TaxID=2710755 RepID=UPI0013CBA0C5|nr:cytochrome c [Wenzhouxiangella sp. XN201]NEZ03808.1 cytochrome c [Wenzhouxiangella sp. XN201]
MRIILSLIISALVLFVVGCVAFWAIALNGRVNVSADGDHWALTEHTLTTIRENAVARSASTIEDATPSLEDTEELHATVIAYEDMCATCHAAPGEAPSLIAQGLNPAPPDLAEVARARTPEEIFWVIRHGIRMTGMPAWGETHADEDLWPLVALIERFPQFEPGQYAVLLEAARNAGARHSHGGHDHGDSDIPMESGAEHEAPDDHSHPQDHHQTDESSEGDHDHDH